MATFDEDILAGLDAALNEVAEENAPLPEEDHLHDGDITIPMGSTTVTLPAATVDQIIEDLKDEDTTPATEEELVQAPLPGFEEKWQAAGPSLDEQAEALTTPDKNLATRLIESIQALTLEVTLLRLALDEDGDGEAEPIQTVEAPAPRRRGRPRKAS